MSDASSTITKEAPAPAEGTPVGAPVYFFRADSIPDANGNDVLSGWGVDKIIVHPTDPFALACHSRMIAGSCLFLRHRRLLIERPGEQPLNSGRPA